jgi:hypothetical protein
MRRGCQPCLVDESGQSVALQRVDFTDTSVAETFLQELLHATPQVLPVDELDASYGPLISLGREISNIDNLFISPNGRVTIVETKLWRNPEATRQVVAQLLDYAVRVSSWDYSGLEKRAHEALASAPIGSGSLYDHVAAQFPDDVLPEPEFVDAVQRGLSTGRFLLLIVGDGIRENVEAMVASLHEHPQKLFTFGLVQMQVFRSLQLPGYLVVPQIVANSTEVVRAVVRVETTGQASVSVEIESAEPKSSGNSGPRHTLSEDEFFASVEDVETAALFHQLLDFGAELGAVPTWGTSSVSMRLRDPAGGQTRFTLFVLTVNGGMYTGWLAQQLNRTGRDSGIATDYVEQLCALFPSVTPRPGVPDSLSATISATEISERLDEFRQVVADLVDRLKGGA